MGGRVTTVLAMVARDSSILPATPFLVTISLTWADCATIGEDSIILVQS